MKSFKVTIYISTSDDLTTADDVVDSFEIVLKNSWHVLEDDIKDIQVEEIEIDHD